MIVSVSAITDLTIFSQTGRRNSFDPLQDERALEANQNNDYDDVPLDIELMKFDGHLFEHKAKIPKEFYIAVENPANSNDPGSTELPILDEQAALETAGGDAELVVLLRETCLREAPNIIAQAKTAVGEQDWKTARRSGHSLRSSFGAVGAMAASAISGEMEMVAEDDASLFMSAIDAVESAFQQFVDHLNA